MNRFIKGRGAPSSQSAAEPSLGTVITRASKNAPRTSSPATEVSAIEIRAGRATIKGQRSQKIASRNNSDQSRRAVTHQEEAATITFRCPPELVSVLPRPVPAVQGLPDWFKALPQKNFSALLQKSQFTVKK